jgi:hypothetical protein
MRGKTRTGDFKYDKCGNRIHVLKRDKILKCSECGNDKFSERENEPENPKHQEEMSLRRRFN